MSPSESQLRAALRSGEGDGVDADVLIARARRARRDRRRRITAAAGISVAVAVVGVGTAAIVASSSGHSGNAGKVAGAAAASASGGGASRSAAAGGAAPYLPTGTGPTSSRVRASAKPPGCPAHPEHYMVPGGGGTGQFGSTEPLFARTVSALTVCAYPAQGAPRSTVITGSAARGLAATLDAAPATAGGETSLCPSSTSAVVELLGTDARGQRLRPVVITVSCPHVQATDGTAVRYLKSLPPVVSRQLQH